MAINISYEEQSAEPQPQPQLEEKLNQQPNEIGVEQRNGAGTRQTEATETDQVERAGDGEEAEKHQRKGAGAE